MGDVDEGADERGSGGDRVGLRSAPHEILGERFEIEPCDDAKIVPAATEGEEEVWIRCVIHIYD